MIHIKLFENLIEEENTTHFINPLDIQPNHISEINIISENDDYIVYSGKFGENGGMSWEVNKHISDGYIIVLSIDRDKDKDTGEAPKEESKGEGTKAIAQLFDIYPKINSILYDDESDGFWSAIGGDNEQLNKEDFYRYYNRKINKKE